MSSTEPPVDAYIDHLHEVPVRRLASHGSRRGRIVRAAERGMARSGTVVADPGRPRAPLAGYGSPGIDAECHDRLASSAERVPQQQRSRRFLPALEGMRGLAVVAVVLFHARVPWAQGGFLGVSAFFTLSGFLITSLLLAEHNQSGTVDLGMFWRRRARRLLPAAFVTIAAVAVLTPLVGSPAQQRNLFGDVAGALGYVANWRFVISGQSYGALFDSPSPLVHFWSLAIEEQFYLCFPLIVGVVLVRSARHPRRRRGESHGIASLGAVLAGLFTLSLAVIFFGGFSRDRIYYGTDTRASELLAGALLAVVLVVRGQPLFGEPQPASSGRASQRLLSWTGLAALIACVVLWSTTAQGVGWLYRGGFVAHALLWCTVLSAAVLPEGPVVRVLSAGPLRFIGRISYGVYLYHWPIFLWLDESRTGLSGALLFAYRVIVTGVVSWVSYRYLEKPILDRRFAGPSWARPSPSAPGDSIGIAGWPGGLSGGPRRIPLGAMAAVAVAVALMVSLVVTLRAPDAPNDFSAAQQRLASMSATGAVFAPPGVPRVAVFGDSTALATGLGLGEVLSASGRAEAVGGKTELGCGIGRGGQRRTGAGTQTVPERCNGWEQEWRTAIARLNPTVAVVQVGPWDVLDRRLEGDTTWRRIGDPVYDAYLRDEMAHAVDVLSSQGAVVVWLTSPTIGAGAAASGQPEWEEAAEPGRMERFNELIRELPSLRPGRVQVVDLAGWLSQSGEDDRLRPDGVHIGEVESREVARRFLMDAVLDASSGNG
ncbi:MAG: acyltransferase [Acidimicrobiales bacterium]|nr:acyltransferase [Acidimicrobiales bacterium]